MTKEQDAYERGRVHWIQNNNHCTEPFQLKPVINTSLVFWRDDRNEKSTLAKGVDDYGTLIWFNQRQTWTVYFFQHGYNMWNCERNGVCVRLHQHDFERVFGTIMIGERTG